ncbi:MAG: hypothetical protein ACR2OE_05670 [Thermomicrobiales bacterium]
MWVLGYDSHCCKCSQIADVIQRMSDDKLSVMGLNDPQMLSWIQTTRAPQDGIRPLLVEITNERPPTVYSGTKMFIKMVTVLGVRKAWSISAKLEDLVRPGLTSSQPKNPRRRQLVKGAAGAALAFGILSGTGRFGRNGTQAQESSDLTVSYPDDETLGAISSLWGGAEYQGLADYLSSVGLVPVSDVN